MLRFCKQSIFKVLSLQAIILTGLPVGMLSADQMQNTYNPNQAQQYDQGHYDYSYDNQGCQTPCCENSCNNNCCWGSNAAVIGGAVLLGGIAGAIAGNSGRSRNHSSGGCGGRCGGSASSSEINNNDAEVGQTLTIEADFSLEQLTGGTFTGTLFAIDPSGQQFLSTPFTFTGTIALDSMNQQHASLSFTVNNPKFGDWLIGVNETLSGGVGNTIAQIGPVTFVITRSSNNTVLQTVLPAPVGLDTDEDLDQANFNFALLNL